MTARKKTRDDFWFWLSEVSVSSACFLSKELLPFSDIFLDVVDVLFMQWILFVCESIILKNTTVQTLQAIIITNYFLFLLAQLIPLLLQLTTRLQGVRALGQAGSDTGGPEDAKRQTKKQKTRRTWGERGDCIKWHSIKLNSREAKLKCIFDNHVWSSHFCRCYLSVICHTSSILVVNSSWSLQVYLL